jgi:general secretion pathway protein H
MTSWKVEVSAEAKFVSDRGLGKPMPHHSSVGKQDMRFRTNFQPSGLEPSCGFTLLEVLVVLVLLATISAVVAPSLGRGIAILELQSTARQIAATLRLARSKAVREQQVYFVGFNIEDGHVGLTSEDLKYQKAFNLPEKVKIKQILRLKTANLHEDVAYSFFFAPNGLSESFEIRLENQRGRELKVVQDSLSRSPRIEELEADGRNES